MSRLDRKLLSGNEAIALGALHSGCALGVGYPGTPSTEILENFSLIGGNAEWAPNEKVAAEVALGAAFAASNSLVTMKHVGFNVAQDLFFTASYSGIQGGMVAVVADDPGMASSQNEQDTRSLAFIGGLPVLEPADSQEAYDFTKLAFEYSRKWGIPFVLRTTTRIAHSNTIVEFPETAPELPKAEFVRDIPARVMVPGHAKPAHARLRAKLADMQKFNEESGPNLAIDGKTKDLCIISSGVAFQHAREAAPEAGFFKVGFSNPLPLAKIAEFAKGYKRCVAVEEGDPYLSDRLRAAGIAVEPRDEKWRFGELNVDRVRAQLAGDLSYEVPAVKSKPPQLCNGCPHVFSFKPLVNLGCIVAGDIGCYNLGTLPPFNAQHTMGAMGASVGVLHGMGLSGLPEPAVCTIGDGTFFHAGVAPLLNMVHNKGKGTVIIMDNRTTAMTGHQDNPGIEATLSLGTVAPVDIAGLCRACGVEKVLTADAFDLAAVRKALEECTAYDGVSVLITRGDCVFVSRSPKPARVVDADKCIACGKCIQSGCPSVVLSDAVHPKTGKRKARIEPVTCVGCGVCTTMCKFDAIKLRRVTDAAGEKYEKLLIESGKNVAKRVKNIAVRKISRPAGK